MKRCRKRKARAVGPLHTTRQEDSRLILRVFQTIFWYMRLSGLVIPLICSHDPCTKTVDDTVQDESRIIHNAHVEAVSTEEGDNSNLSRKRRVYVNPEHSQPLDKFTRSTQPGSVQTSPGLSERVELNASDQTVVFIPYGIFERDNSDTFSEQVSLCKKHASKNKYPDTNERGRRNTNINSDTKQKRTQITKMVAKKEKRQQSPRNSKDSVDTNFIRVRPAQDQMAQDTEGKFRTTQSEQQSYRHIVTSPSYFISVDDVESHGRTTLASNPKGDVDSEEEEPNHCSKCQFLILLNRILCVTVSIVLVANCLRYSSVFFLNKIDKVHLICAVGFQSFFAGITLIYILSAYEMAKHFPQFQEKMQNFEKTYGVSLDLKNFRRRIERKCRYFFTFQVAFSLGFILLEQFVFPSLREYLTPFHNSEGIGLYLALIAFAIVLTFINSFIAFVFGFIASTTYFLVLEFNNISSDLCKILAKPGTVLVLSTQDLPLTGVNTSVNSASSADRLDYGGSCSRRSLTQPSMKSNRSSSAVMSSHDGTDTRHASKTKLYTTGNDDRIQHGCDMSDNLNMTMSDLQNSVENYKHLKKCSDPGQKKKLRFLDEFGEKCQAYARSKSLHHKAADTMVQEASFDILRAKHQMLCELLAKTNQCVRHFVSLGFGGSFPLTCLIIYVLSSGSLDLANVLFLSHNLLYVVVYLVVIIFLAFHAHDAAHAVQEVMFAADWSQFSDRLLTKIQIFSSRLGHSQIGYDVYGLFVIDRSTVLMVAGTLVTYTVVVIQFQQAEASHCANTTAPS